MGKVNVVGRPDITNMRYHRYVLESQIDGPVRDTLHRSVSGDVAETLQAFPVAQSVRRRDRPKAEYGARRGC